MYHCYLRGKQFELVAIKESINKILAASITPIIEPVKLSNNSLLNCITEIGRVNVPCIVIINPQVGEWVNNHHQANQNINDIISVYPNITLGFIIHNGTDIIDLTNALSVYPNNQFALIHWGECLPTLNLATYINNQKNRFIKNIFIDGLSGHNYINSLNMLDSVLIRDGFNKLSKNSDYAQNLVEFFSDLHTQYKNFQFSGFGDFSLIGDFYNDGGFQPWTVAVHLSYTPEGNSFSIYVEHFLSGLRAYQESVNVLIEEALIDIGTFLKSRPDILNWSTACQEIIQLIQLQKSTNLGYLKKLSIKHHIELMHYLKMMNVY